MTRTDCARLASLALVVLLSGCATYSDRIGVMERAIVAKDPVRALRVLEAQPGGRKDDVLYLLNKAMLQRMQGEYAASNAALEEAKPLMEKFATLSVSEQAAAFAINENVRAYAGELFEQVYVHVIAALNYLALNAPHSARVEALQLDVKLNQIKQGAAVDDGFPRYLTGLIYERLGDWDDALIAYRKAYQAYKSFPSYYSVGVPYPLKDDLLRLTARQGMNDEHERYRTEFGIKEWSAATSSADTGEVVFILLSGLAPVKRDAITGAVTQDGRMVTVALPYFEQRRAAANGVRISTAGRSAESALMSDVNNVAVTALDHKLAGITARAIARAVIKTRAVSKAQQEGNGALGLLINVAGVATERADTRSWTTLPNQIYLARLQLPPGRYDLQVQVLSSRGGVLGVEEYNDLELLQGDQRIITRHWVTPQDLLPSRPFTRPALVDQRKTKVKESRH